MSTSPMSCQTAGLGLISIVAVSLTFPVVAAAQDSSPIKAANCAAPIKVACVGDSITQGGADGRPWPSQLREMLGDRWNVQNFGASGTTLMKSGDSPYQKHEKFGAAKALHPDVVIIALGTNDTKAQNWKNFEKDFEADLIDMVKQSAALSSKPRIFVCCPPYIARGGNWGINDGNTLQEIPVITKVAKAMNLGIIDLHGALKDKDGMIPDNVHPNAEGQKEIALAVLQALTGKNGQKDILKQK